MGGPHFGARVRVKAGARSPVHCHVLPSGPFTVPDKILPVQVPSKTMSAFAPSSSFGEINIRRPFESSAFERRSEEHTSELQSRLHLVCRLLLEKKKIIPHCS